MTNGPGYGGHVVLDRLLLNRPPKRSPSDAHRALLGIGDRIVEVTGEINDEAIFGGRSARATVPPAANRDWKIILTRVLQGDSDICGVFDESDDSSWPLGVGCPARYSLFIARVCGGYDVALEGLPEVRNVGHSGQRGDAGIDGWHFATLFMSI